MSRRTNTTPDTTPARDIAPFGWYVASYLLRFVELDRTDKDDPDARFISWENTVLIQATGLDQAYEKAVKIAMDHTEPYKGGSDAADVQWVFEGVTELLPIYEELEDGAEIMWAEHKPRKLKNLQRSVRDRAMGGYHCK